MRNLAFELEQFSLLNNATFFHLKRSFLTFDVVGGVDHGHDALRPPVHLVRPGPDAARSFHRNTGFT